MVGTVLVLVAVGFVVLQDPYRHFEVWLSGGLLARLHAPDVIGTVGDDMFVRHAGTDQAIDLILAPQCSSLPAVLAIIALALPMVPTTGRRVWRGAAVASGLALIGNVVRIDAVIAVGVFSGYVALVLFHTWVAAVFDFAAVLAGWVIMVRMQLPRARRPVADVPSSAATDGVGVAAGPASSIGAASSTGSTDRSGGLGDRNTPS
jgi:exosortase/archaeosortase family protein